MNVTILIPTRNRQRLLKRVLSYYEGCRVLVADSSDKPTGPLIFAPEIHPYEKCAMALKHVETEYCVVGADDDFIIPTSIEEAAKFLDANRDYSVCHGRYIPFTENNGFTYYGSPSYPSIKQDTSSARFKEHLSKYIAPTFYGVHRTQWLSECFDRMVGSRVSFPLFGELLLSMLTIIQGKMKYLDMPYAVRSINTTASDWLKLRQVMAAGVTHSEYRRFRNCLLFVLGQPLTIEEIDKAMDSYLKIHVFNKEYTKRTMGKIALLLDHAPEWAGNLVRLPYRWLFDKTPPPVYYPEFEKIKEALWNI